MEGGIGSIGMIKCINHQPSHRVVVITLDGVLLSKQRT